MTRSCADISLAAIVFYYSGRWLPTGNLARPMRPLCGTSRDGPSYVMRRCCECGENTMLTTAPKIQNDIVLSFG